MTAKQIVLSYYPKAIIRRCQSAFKRSIEYRVILGMDQYGNCIQIIGETEPKAWMNAKNLIETTK